MVNAALPKILMNEDDEATRDALTELLHDEGYETAFVSTIEEAREQLARGNYALLILDVQTAGTNVGGIEWLQDFIRTGDGPRTMIVSCSPGAKQIADRFGVPYLKKPFDLDTLLENVVTLTRTNVRPADGYGP
jgi:DNA-binding response OmpR family regulator